MSKHKSQAPKPAASGAAAIHTVVIKPPPETDQSAPPFANEIRVVGGTDALTLHFYYVSPPRIGGHLDGQRPDEKMRVKDGFLMIESEPVARVSIPLSAAAQLILAMSEAIVGGVPQIQEALSSMGQRMQQLQDLQPKRTTDG